MNRPPGSSVERPLYLTEDEALSLLEVCLYCKDEMDPARAAAMHKLGELCRGYLVEREADVSRDPRRAPRVSDLVRASA